VIVAAYSDYLKKPTTLPVPDFIAAPRLEPKAPGVTLWRDVLASGLRPGPLTAGPDDLCVMPYTSGTTGQPKGCMHTHRSVMHTLVGSMRWFALQPETTLMSVAPLFHVTGMQGGMNGPLYIGNTVVMLPRWDRNAAAECVQRYRVASWTAVPTMIQDFFANPNIADYDLSSIRRLSGGGAAMPAAVAQRLLDMGVTYYEGYGLSETMAATHLNPLEHPKKQCLGIPSYDVDSRVVDPATLAELPAGEVGEIVIHAPQVFLGYWNRPEESAEALVQIDGKRFLRTGDLGRVDEDGYFFMVDRLKRMINASGFKVWPTEVESLMYQHPAVLEACVIGTQDAHRGETVKAVVVPRSEWRGRIDAQAIIDWCRENMAAYKCPRIVEFVEALPKSGAGKIMWRELQDRETAANQRANTP
jgi:fatty-acyl-CoA synthase